MTKMRIAMMHSVVLSLLLITSTPNGGSSLALPTNDAHDRAHHQDAIKLQRIISKQRNSGNSKIVDFAISPTSNTAAAGAGAATAAAAAAASSSTPNQQPIVGLRRAVSALRTTFLPIGFPQSTPDGYLRYSVWSWLQDLSTQLRGVLATQRVLEGVGVGKEGATALSALMNYLVRDASGMAATLLFTYAASSNFRSDIKRWRLFADIMVDLGITLEVAATLFPPQFFLPMISVGNICKAMCGVAAGACGGVINLYWSRGSDLSDINAKFGAQHTVTGAMGLLFAAFFAQSVSNVRPWRLWMLYSFLTIFHIFANTRCMRLIAFDELNTGRMQQLLGDAEWSENTKSTTSTAAAAAATATGILPATTQTAAPASVEIPSPIEVAQKEPLFFQPWKRLVPRLFRPSSKPEIRFGDSLNSLMQSTDSTTEDILWTLRSNLTQSQNETKYILRCGERRSGTAAKHTICVAFFGTSTNQDRARAYLHVHLLAERLAQQQKAGMLQDQDGNVFLQRLCEETQQEVSRLWPIFNEKCLQSGWDLTKTVLDDMGYEMEMQ